MLDPQRIGLNAQSVGFLARTGQSVDWTSFKQALQTDDSRVADVRATVETPVDELHVMGGQRFGLEGNTNLKTNARQERQINGYPLRSFSAHAPAIILPDKYGGLPMYTRDQTEYTDFVSRYTAPLSAALQNDTVLLGRQGYSVTNESASQPFKDVGFEHNMHKSKDAIDYNEAVIQQRQWLQRQSQIARKQKYGDAVNRRRSSAESLRGVKNAVDGIFISADGAPMTQVASDSLGDMSYDAYIASTHAPEQVPAQALVRPMDNLSYNSAGRSSWLSSKEIVGRGYTNMSSSELFEEELRRKRISREIYSVEGATDEQVEMVGSGSFKPRDKTQLTYSYNPIAFQDNSGRAEAASGGMNPKRLSYGSDFSTPSPGTKAAGMAPAFYGLRALKAPAGTPKEKIYSLKKRQAELIRGVEKERSRRNRIQARKFSPTEVTKGKYKGYDGDLDDFQSP